MNYDNFFDTNIKKSSKITDVARQLASNTLPMIKVTVYGILLTLMFSLFFWFNKDLKINRSHDTAMIIGMLLFVIGILIEMKIPQVIFQGASSHLFILQETQKSRKSILNKDEAISQICNIGEGVTYQISLLSRDSNNYFKFVLIYTSIIAISTLQTNNHYLLPAYLIIILIYLDQFDGKKYNSKQVFRRLHGDKVKPIDIYLGGIIEYSINGKKRNISFRRFDMSFGFHIISLHLFRIGSQIYLYFESG